MRKKFRVLILLVELYLYIVRKSRLKKVLDIVDYIRYKIVKEHGEIQGKTHFEKQLFSFGIERVVFCRKQLSWNIAPSKASVIYKKIVEEIRDYYFDELYCSTLDNIDLELGENYNVNSKKFVYNFLNEDYEFLYSIDSKNKKIPDRLY